MIFKKINLSLVVIYLFCSMSPVHAELTSEMKDFLMSACNSVIEEGRSSPEWGFTERVNSKAYMKWHFELDVSSRTRLLGDPNEIAHQAVLAVFDQVRNKFNNSNYASEFNFGLSKEQLNTIDVYRRYLPEILTFLGNQCDGPVEVASIKIPFVFSGPLQPEPNRIVITRTTEHDEVLTLEMNHSQLPLGPSWRFPTGEVWSPVVRKEDGTAHLMTYKESVDYCAFFGLRVGLPTPEAVQVLREVFGASRGSGDRRYSPRGYTPQIMMGLQHPIWINDGTLFDGIHGKIRSRMNRDDRHAVRCMIK